MIQWLSRFPIRIILAQLALNYRNQDDNWRSIKSKYSPSYFGSKCEKDFSSYFDGKLTVKASNIEEAMDWLGTCNYQINDNEWKHPTEFEKLKEGDCKDYSLWLWRRLVENGCEAIFVSGERVRNEKLIQHAWIILKENDEQFIVDPLSIYEGKTLNVASYKDKYIPWLAVSNKFEYYIYGGYIRKNVLNP